MILSKCFDVEILPNYFGVVIIDLNDYLNKFKDCINEKGKPIPLVQKYTVTEIITLLDNVKKVRFHITDKDDSQLLTMVGYFNQMMPHYNEFNKAVRTDLFGFNSHNYDDLMIAGLLMWVNQTNTTKELITNLYNLSKKIISLQNDKDMSRNDYILNTLRHFKLPYVGIDVMTIFALNKVGKGVDSKTGETIYFPKSLKQTSINLQWYELLEYELPPITEKDVHFYNKMPMYKGLTTEQINEYVDKWDRYILEEWIPDMEHYNCNDVYIVCEMIRLNIDEVRLRYNITHSYNVDVLSSSRSNIADKLFIKMYSDFSNLTPSQWRGKKTERTALSFKRVIFPFIKFKTKSLQDFLEEMKQVIIYSIGKKALKDVAHKYKNLKYLKVAPKDAWFEITINNLTYSIATGGLHSQDLPRELKSRLIDVHSSTGEVLQSIPAETTVWDNITDNSFIYVHWDIASFYPSIMDVYRIAPDHMITSVFVNLVHYLKETRVKAKHSKEALVDGIPKDILAQALKIVINSIYGKLGFEHGDLCDRLAVLKVTINGQLMIMMLCEELELNGIEVVSANTDGIVVKLYKKDKQKFEEIADNWKKLTKLNADSEEYLCYINRDINNYFCQEVNGKITYKGTFNPLMYAVDLTKGYDMPVVAQAVVNYFLYDKPILETLYECDNILDFCKTQNVGRQFHVEYTEGSENTILQRNVRFYVSNTGGYIYKVNDNDSSRNGLCAGEFVTVLNTLDDKPIGYRNIQYGYYYREAMKIIDPIKLNISPNLKGNKVKGTKSGKAILKKNSGCYNSLFDDLEE